MRPQSKKAERLCQTSGMYLMRSLKSTSVYYFELKIKLAMFCCYLTSHAHFIDYGMLHLQNSMTYA